MPEPYCSRMARRDKRATVEPVQISSRFTLKVFAREQAGGSLKAGLVRTAVQAVLDGSYEPTALATTLTIRLTDLETGSTVDDEVSEWSAQADADFDQAADTLRQMSDAEILEAFFEPPSD